MKSPIILLCALALLSMPLAVSVAGTVAPDFPGEDALWLLPGAPEASTCSWGGVLPNSTAAPYGAVGFVSNGCTATLIDPAHVLTAAHCIVNEGAKTYWSGMWFYPNYNREANPARFRIARAVVGAHDRTGFEYYTSDWAIARLATPAAGFATIPISPAVSTATPVTVAHYSRDPLLFVPNCATPPYRDELGCTPGWPNWFGNAWWQNGLVSRGTVTTDSSTGYSLATAPGLGGASGSPHLIQPLRGFWRINGVTHGAECAGVGGPWAGRFVNVPWFAANVAVASAPSAASRSGVFVIDRDRNRLAYRERTVSGTTSPFGFFRYGKTLPSGFHSRIAAFKLGGTGRPGVVVLNSAGVLKEADYANGWSGWKLVSAPPSGTVTDLDASYDKAGVNMLFAVGSPSGGRLYVRRRISGAAGAGWRPSWQLAAADAAHSYRRVTALRHHGDRLNQAWMLSSLGVIRTVRERSGGGWRAPVTFTGPALAAGERIVDIDAAWNRQNRGLLVALSSRGRAWYREAGSTLSGVSWSGWKLLPSQVDPGVPVNRGGVRLTTVTASRWAETVWGAIVPVVFATDTWGNVYQTTWLSASSSWSRWMPFYGRRINSTQTIAD